MTVRLKSGEEITVKRNGKVIFRGRGRQFVNSGRGNYAESCAWVRSFAYGSDVSCITG